MTKYAPLPMDEPLHIHGTPPVLAGTRCENLFAGQFRHCGELVDELNAIYLCCDGTWHRLVFDCGDVFWKIQSPASFDAPDIAATYQVVDLGTQFPVSGKHLSGYETTRIRGGSQVEFRFIEGGRLVFQNVNDRTVAHWIEV